MKPVVGIIAVFVYGIWAYSVPVAALRTKYGESGLMWGILVFGLMIPYIIYFVYGVVRPKSK
jgi:hypothetical protein